MHHYKGIHEMHPRVSEGAIVSLIRNGVVTYATYTVVKTTVDSYGGTEFLVLHNERELVVANWTQVAVVGVNLLWAAGSERFGAQVRARNTIENLAEMMVFVAQSDDDTDNIVESLRNYRREIKAHKAQIEWSKAFHERQPVVIDGTGARDIREYGRSKDVFAVQAEEQAVAE